MTLGRAQLLVCLGLLAACGGGETERANTPEEGMTNPTPVLPAITATNAFYYYKDLNEAWAFYTRTLGFVTIADYGFAKILRVGPTSCLTLVDETRGMHSSSEPKSVTLAVVTDEVEGWWEYLSGAGVEMRSPLGPEDGGPAEGRPHDGFVAIDPEGYLLEFERFNEHPENEALLPVLNQVEPLFPDGTETAPGVNTTRPETLGVRGTVLWLYYQDLEGIQAFYREALGVDILVDQGWAKVFPASLTGFLGFVDGERGLHQATEEKAVTVSFFTTGLELWLEHMRGVLSFELRAPGISSEGDFVRTFVGYDPEGYYLEWDEFLEVEANHALLRSVADQKRQP
ncbi:MAG: VOC family protein [Gemmatimonadota bacterium]